MRLRSLNLYDITYSWLCIRLYQINVLPLKHAKKEAETNSCFCYYFHQAYTLVHQAFLPIVRVRNQDEPLQLVYQKTIENYQARFQRGNLL